MSFLEWVLIILSLVSGLCYVIVSALFLLTKRLSRKKYRWFVFASVFLFIFFAFLIPFSEDFWGRATISEYIFFIVIIFILSSAAGGFMVLGDIYHEKLTGFSQSKLLKVMQKQVDRESEGKEKEDK